MINPNPSPIMTMQFGLSGSSTDVSTEFREKPSNFENKSSFVNDDSQRRILGVTADYEALARQLSELGSGAQSVRPDVPSTGRHSPGGKIPESVSRYSRLQRAYRGALPGLWSPRGSSPDSALFTQRNS